MTTESLIAERDRTHGNYAEQATLAMTLKRTMRLANSFTQMHDCHQDALEMIAVKISRILSGNSDFRDHWDDIAGYALLAAKQCPPLHGDNNAT